MNHFHYKKYKILKMIQYITVHKNLLVIRFYDGWVRQPLEVNILHIHLTFTLLQTMG